MHTSVELQGSSPRGVFALGAMVPRVSLQTLAVLRFLSSLQGQVQHPLDGFT